MIPGIPGATQGFYANSTMEFAGDVALRDDEMDEDDIPDDAPIGPDVLRVHLTPYMAQQFARRANSVVAGGVPVCPYCGAVLEPPGHFCSRRYDDLVH